VFGCCGECFGLEEKKGQKRPGYERDIGAGQPLSSATGIGRAAYREAVRVLRQHGLEARIGELSTLVWGEEQVVFGERVAAHYEAWPKTPEGRRADALKERSRAGCCAASPTRAAF
jgi:hypothetical protein